MVDLKQYSNVCLWESLRQHRDVRFWPISDRLFKGPADGRFVTRSCLSRLPIPDIQIAISGRSRNYHTPQILLSFMLRQKEESQHAQHGKAERGFLAVPGMRLPHEEILPTDNLKPR